MFDFILLYIFFFFFFFFATKVSTIYAYVLLGFSQKFEKIKIKIQLLLAKLSPFFFVQFFFFFCYLFGIQSKD
jgi:hypothetical protein